MTHLLLIRHAANDWLNNRLAGWMPGVHLNERGRQQAEALARRLAPLPLAAVYSSPLERAVETAQFIAAPHGLEVQIREALGETHFGELDGRPLDEVRREEVWKRSQIYPSGTRFPGGETMYEVQSRAVFALEEILQAHPQQIVAVVSHADVIRVVVAHYIGLPLALFRRLVVSPASLTVLRFTETGPRLMLLNDTGELFFAGG